MLPSVTKLLRHRSVQIVLALLLYLIFADHLPLPVHQGFYTISLIIKELLLWMLPVTVCFFIAHAIASFEKRAPLFILCLFFFEAISNTASVWYAYGCGYLCSSSLPVIASQPIDDSFSALAHLPFSKPLWWSADKGMFAGIVLGFIASWKLTRVSAFVSLGKEIAERVLTRFFSRLIPLFILGFIARMYKTRLLQQLFSQYAQLFIWLIIILVAYIAFLILAGNGFSGFKKAWKNLLPAGGIAFSSGCSLSTMPWTIEGASKNMQNSDLAKAVIPATTNIQQIGDCIANTFLCFLIYRQFNGVPPDLETWAAFSVIFVLARFATAAVLGGAIFIMLPIYESCLGFNSEMIAMILAFNVILDPIITSSNVLANGALCRIFERVWLFKKSIRVE
jgi:hypothetical protein